MIAKEAKKEIELIGRVLKQVKLVKREGTRLLELAKAYYEDSKYFLEKRSHLEAFEAVVISWAYLDAGLHLKVFTIPANLKSFFTA